MRASIEVGDEVRTHGRVRVRVMCSARARARARARFRARASISTRSIIRGIVVG